MSGQIGSGWMERTSGFSFEATVGRLTAAIAGAGMTVFARIDHADNAAQVGLAMPPTTVLIYGNARGGTPIMLAVPQVALDLPLRVLVREADGKTLVSFHPVAAMLQQAGVPGEMAAKLEGAQRVLLAAIEA